MNNTISSMIGMKTQLDAINLDTVLLNKTYPKESVLPEDTPDRAFVSEELSNS